MAEPAIRILRADSTEPVAYAAEELRTYLAEMTDEAVDVVEADGFDPATTGLWVGEASSIPDAEPPSVDDPAFDDAISVHTEGRTGIVSGVNPRSVLLAAYRYLREQGCRWIRPGPDGEIVPSVDVLADVTVDETASYRHRGITIEGAVGYRHVRDIVDWAPKVGYNSYFLQFFEGYPFFQRWYDHEQNPYLDPEPFDLERSRELFDVCVDEIQRRGMVYHAVGHGWQAEAFDLPAHRFNATVEDAPNDVIEYLAELDGERQLARDMPMRSEICYSNREARRRVVETAAAYAADHPEVDVLHFWLSDNVNNHCECADCRGIRPSDFYVRMLNELDAALADRGVETKVAFLLYNDLLWPPETETIQNPERFTLMFAPSDRDYLGHFGEVDEIPDLPPFELNDLEFRADLATQVGFLRGWQETFDGDGFVFDYHLMWNHGPDPGYVGLTDVIGGDMRHVHDLGLRGNLSCQSQRSFFPTATPNYVMGRTLWNCEASTQELLETYFDAAFGSDGRECLSYLRTLSRQFEALRSWDHSDMWGELESDPDVAASLARVPETVAEFRPVLERNRDHADSTRELSWLYLELHADIVEDLGRALAAKARGEDEAARRQWRDLREQIQRREDTLHRTLDVYWFVDDMDNTFGVSASGAP
jgi:hypothetical protein